jgi:hypothetical protein
MATSIPLAFDPTAYVNSVANDILFPLKTAPMVTATPSATSASSWINSHGGLLLGMGAAAFGLYLLSQKKRRR